MKQALFFLFVIFSVNILEAQQLEKGYSSSKLTFGYPSEVAVKVEGLNEVKSTEFDTGIDSIKIYFGTFSQGNERLYWASLYLDKKNNFSMFNLQSNDSSALLADDIEFKFNNASMKVSMKIFHNPETDEVFFQWRDKNGSSPIASVQKIDRLIQENEPMPHFNVQSIKGSHIDLNDFKGKFLVINWWATSCAPCITEMPGLNELVEKYQSRADVDFIAIARDDRTVLEKFLKKREFNYQQTLYNEKVASLFGNSFPKHIIVNPEGIVIFYLEGGSPEINLYIEDILKNQLENS